MTKLAAPLIASTLALASAAHAGGPVIVEETVEAETPRSGWIVPVIVGAIILCAIACGSDDDTTSPTTLG